MEAMRFRRPTALAQSDPGVDQTLDEFSRLTATDWIVAASIVLGAIIIGLILRTVTSRLLKGRSGHLVAELIARTVFALTFALGLVYALNQVGVSVGPLLGLLGLLGLALALAFQEVLGNFIAGVMLSLQRPFRIGDEISTSGYNGTVEDVNLRSTTMTTFDGVRVFIPNSTVWEEPIENYTAHGSRRTTLELGVGYDADLDAVQEILLDTMASVEGIESKPPAQAFVHEFGDNSINFAVRFWHKPGIATEWSVRDSLSRRLKERLDEAGVDIPFPQMVLHMDATDPEREDPS